MNNSNVVKFLSIFYLTINLAFFVSYYPGIYNVDAYIQIHESYYGAINNMHPAINTIIGLFLLRIWTHPSVFILYQILLGLINLVLLNKLYIAYSVHKNIILLANLVYIMSPYHLFFNMHYGKDTIYGYIFSTVTIYLLLLFKKERPLLFMTSLILIALTVYTSLIRHNAFPMLFIIPLCCALLQTRGNRKKTYASYLFFVLGGYMAIIQLLYPFFRVTPYQQSYPYFSLIHDVAAVINEGTYQFNREERDFYSNILPFEYWKKYYVPLDRNILVHHRYMFPDDSNQPNFSFFENDMEKSKRILFYTIFRNIPLVISNHLSAYQALLLSNNDEYVNALNKPRHIQIIDSDMSNLMIKPEQTRQPNLLYAIPSTYLARTIGSSVFIRITSPFINIFVVLVASLALLINKKYIEASLFGLAYIVYTVTFFIHPTNISLSYMFYTYLYIFMTPCFMPYFFSNQKFSIGSYNSSIQRL